jgi:SM-20-related protein
MISVGTTALVQNFATVPSMATMADPEAGWLDAIAGGLSERGWLSVDVRPVLGDELLSSLGDEVRILDRSDALRAARIGRGPDKTRDQSVRRDKIAWLQGETAAQAALFRVFESIRAGLNQRLFLGLRRFEAHYATYHPGDFYRKHVDAFRGRSNRVLTTVTYLNPDWQDNQGGELLMYDEQAQPVSRLLPTLGSMVIFLSEEFPHEVLAAKRTRFSIAGWYRNNNSIQNRIDPNQ